MRRRFVRVLVLIVILCIGSVFGAEIIAYLDLYSFEYEPIFRMIGWRGLALALALNGGLVLLLVRLFSTYRNRPPRHARIQNVSLIAFGLLFLWVFDWVYVSNPISLRIFGSIRGTTAPQLNSDLSEDFAKFSLAANLKDANTIERLKTMYERILVNNAEMYGRNPIGATIDRYAARYNIDPALLFFLNYIDSFYGEAESGPVPFLRAMTGESIRDLVQVHLPGWFIENGVRRAFINFSGLSDVVDRKSVV